MGQAKVKGILAMHLNSYLVSLHGEEGLAQVCAQLRPQVAHLIRSPIAHEWYPHLDFLEVEEAITQVHFGGDITQAWRFGHFNMEQSVHRVYRFLFRLLSPEHLLKKSAKLWGTFMDQGTMKAESLGPRAVALEIEGFVPAKPVWCHEMRGALLGALEVCSIPEAQGRVVETCCAFKGAKRCRFEVSW